MCRDWILMSSILCPDRIALHNLETKMYTNVTADKVY